MRALVADEWSVLRNGVAAVLAQCGVTTVTQAGTATEAVGAVERAQYDVVVLGSVADVTPAVAVTRLLGVGPHLGILVLLNDGSRDDAIDVLDAGAHAVLPRNATEADLREAALRLTLGQRYLSPTLLAAAFGPRRGRPPADVRDPFTDRERDVLRLLVNGCSNRDIADKLFIGESTVKTHLRNVYAKLEVTNRVQAVHRVMDRKLL